MEHITPGSQRAQCAGSSPPPATFTMRAPRGMLTVARAMSGTSTRRAPTARNGQRLRAVPGARDGEDPPLARRRTCPTMGTAVDRRDWPRYRLTKRVRHAMARAECGWNHEGLYCPFVPWGWKGFLFGRVWLRMSRGRRPYGGQAACTSSACHASLEVTGSAGSPPAAPPPVFERTDVYTRAAHAARTSRKP